MAPNLRVVALFILFGLVAGQAPPPNGIDSEAFLPRTDGAAPPPGPRIATASPSPSRSPPPCRRQRIRALDGRCTSRSNGEFGRAREVHLSLFGVDSSDFDNTERNSPRFISNTVANQVGNIPNDRGLNELTTFFGQFIDHNFALAPLSDEEMDIEPAPGEDTELPFRRSERAPVPGAPAGVELPVNVLTSALDLVAVYGSSEERNQALRVPNSCLLKTSEGDLLPFNTVGLTNSPSNDSELYVAGDTRSNEHPILTVMHTIWLREHNSLCERLAPVLRFLSADLQYEGARALNIAQFQKVVLEEFFPAITGRELRPPFRRFRRNVNPTLSSLFSTAAFRVGHTLVNDGITLIEEDGSISEVKPLRESFFVPRSVEDGIDPFLRGVTRTAAQEIDAMVVDGLRNFLFEDVEDEEGPDLIALNLQRSRDHNIPPYNDIREFFGLPRVTSFSEISSDTEVQNRLSEAYDGDVDKIEAWIGMMAEDHIPRSSFGPTLFRVWRAEFLRLRDGDQFFFRGRRGFPRFLRNPASDFIGIILDPNRQTFREILLRNSGISESDLNDDDVFKVPGA